MKKFVLYLMTLFIFVPLQAQWVKTSLDSVNVYSFAISGTNLYAGSDRAVFLSTNNGASWTTISKGLVDSTRNGIGVQIYANKDTIMIAYVSYFMRGASGLRRSTNNGVSWSTTGLAYEVNSLVVKGTNIFASSLADYGPRGIFLSTDYGISWTESDSGLISGNYAYKMDVWTLAVNAENIYAGGNGGVFLSTNDGKNWSAINNGLPTGIRVTALSVSGNNLYAGAESKGLFLSTNNGTNWLDLGLISHYVSSITSSGNNAFVGTRTTFPMSTVDTNKCFILCTSDNGAHWIESTTGLPRYSYIYSLVISGTNLYAGTDKGVWRRPLSEMIPTSVQQTSSQLPEHYSLSQNYPNPFNPSTTFTYSIPERSTVRISIFNTLGKKISDIVNEIKEADVYEHSFNASQLSSSVYFYRIEATSTQNTGKTFVNTKKMVLLR